MKYSFIKKTLSDYNYASASNFIHSFGLFCCSQPPFVKSLSKFLADKSLVTSINTTTEDFAELISKITKEFEMDENLKTDQNSSYAKLLQTLTENLVGYDVIDLCLRKGGSNINVATLRDIKQEAFKIRIEYQRTHENFKSSYRYMHSFETKQIDAKIVQIELEIQNEKDKETNFDATTFEARQDIQKKRFEIRKILAIKDVIENLQKPYQEILSSIDSIKEAFDTLPSSINIEKEKNYLEHCQKLKEICEQLNAVVSPLCIELVTTPLSPLITDLGFEPGMVSVLALEDVLKNFTSPYQTVTLDS